MDVLIVEDDPGISEPLVTGLRREGFTATAVATGADALAAPTTYDLLLVDIGLPDMDGFEVCRRILARSDVPIILAFPDVGAAVTILVFVIMAVGAASEEGADLDELLRIGQKVNSVTRTMGLALTACTPPAKGSPLFELGADEMEVGVGIHGEPGRERRKLTNADAIVDELLDAVVTDLPYNSGDRVALMINGLGGTPISELYILYRRAHQQLADRGIAVGRSYVNEYCTSLDMAGASLTLVRLDEEIERLLEAPAETAIRIF